MKLFSDSIPSVVRKSSEELFLIRIVAKPKPENAESLTTGGAYVNCRANADDLRSAEQTAIEAIQNEEWLPVKFDHWEIVCRRCYDEPERRENLERIDEAFEYGISLTFNCWPINAPDANDEF